jgi:hypothetical protein
VPWITGSRKILGDCIVIGKFRNKFRRAKGGEIAIRAKSGQKYKNNLGSVKRFNRGSVMGNR